jgi:hypothetical protein
MGRGMVWKLVVLRWDILGNWTIGNITSVYRYSSRSVVVTIGTCSVLVTIYSSVTWDGTSRRYHPLQISPPIYFGISNFVKRRDRYKCLYPLPSRFYARCFDKYIALFAACQLVYRTLISAIALYV